MRVELKIDGDAGEPGILEVLAALRRAAGMPGAPAPAPAPAAASVAPKEAPAEALASVDTPRGAKKRAKAAPAPAPAPEPEALEAWTWPEVVAEAQRHAASSPQRVVDALTKCGVRRVDALKPEQYAAFMEALRGEGVDDV